MKCPKCEYTSFDYLRECKKCGEILDDSRKALNLKMDKPILFTGLDDDSKSSEKSETDKTGEDTGSTSSATVFVPEADFSSSSHLDLPPDPPLPTPEEQYAEDFPENATSGLGTLGRMDNIQPRENDLENSRIESGLPDTDAIEGLELTPSFGDDIDNDVSHEEDVNKETEFVLFADDDKPVSDNKLENDIQFEFSGDDLESDITSNIQSSNSDKDMIELELDMEDEESLDQILAGLETNDNSTK